MVWSWGGHQVCSMVARTVAGTIQLIGRWLPLPLPSYPHPHNPLPRPLLMPTHPATHKPLPYPTYPAPNCQSPPSPCRPKLSGTLFQKDLGSLLDKSDRCEALVPMLAQVWKVCGG